MEQVKKLYFSDWLGASVSILCAIHCAATPLLFLAKPIVDTAVHSHEHGHGSSPLWASLDWIFLILSLGAVWYSSKHTSHKSVRLLLWVFWAIFVIGILSEMAGIEALHWLVYVGSISLAVTHMFNFRYYKSKEQFA